MPSLPQSIQRLLARPLQDRRIGPFMLVEPLGRGGFAPVWLAREVYGGTELRKAAVKLFALDAAAGDAGGSAVDVRRRTLHEARALCQVEHPNVVRFYALPIDEASGVIGLAMERVEGLPLDRRIAAGRLELAETLGVGIAIASALEAVHRAGLVHRDVKPANVVQAGGIYKLIDFGIAAADALVVPRPALERGAPGIELADQPVGLGSTRTVTDVASDEYATFRGGMVSGTLGYIDPACMTGAPPDASSDLYALGATLFECASGKVPAAARAGHVGLEGRVLDGRVKPVPLLEIVPSLPAAFAQLVDALVDPDRRARPVSGEWVAIELEQIRNEMAGAARLRPPEDTGPFRGLARFQEADRDVYFGRTGEISTALEMVRSRGLLALVGPSGSGKSSLARAGVLPALAEGALGDWPKRWDVAVAEPGADPRAAVAAALSLFVPDSAALEPEALISALAEHARSKGTGVVLLLDQAEELTTLASGPSRDWTVAFLGRLGEQAIPGVRVVVTVRRDLLDPLLALGSLGRALIRGAVLIEPVTALAWAASLDQGLAAYGYAFEDDALRAEILAAIAPVASAMPLVQFALCELWEKRDPSAKRITRAGFDGIGGIAGALERHAEATLAELEEEIAGAEPSLKAMLLALTTPHGTRCVVGREVVARAGGAAGRKVLSALERARLVASESEGVTLAHEALIAQWGRLRTWVAEARDDRLLAAEVEDDAKRWRADPEHVSTWQKRRLAFGEALVGREEPRLSGDAIAFLKAGRSAQRRTLVAIAATVTVALLAIAGVGVTYVRAVKAEEAKTRAALQKEQASRELAERQTREVQGAQRRIDGLLSEMAASQSKDAVQELQRTIRQVGATGDRVVGPKGTGGPARAADGAPSGSATPPARLEVEQNW